MFYVVMIQSNWIVCVITIKWKIQLLNRIGKKPPAVLQIGFFWLLGNSWYAQFISNNARYPVIQNGTYRRGCCRADLLELANPFS